MIRSRIKKLSSILQRRSGRQTVRRAIRINNLKPSIEQLESRVLLAIDLPPDILVGRTLSAYSVSDVQNNQLKLTYSVYNQREIPIDEVRLANTLKPGVTFVAGSQPPNQNGQDLTWSLGTIPAYGRASVEITVSLAAGNILQLDEGAQVFGTIDAGVATDSAPAAVLRSSPIIAGELSSTPDANTTDPVIQEKAAELDYDPAKIFAYLRDDVGYESYVGSLRGARGALWSEAGNSLDEASLGVALFRASGIPARYAHGTLSDANAQALILSMFPEPTQLVGYLAPGTAVADPANDPTLLAETRDHYWLQIDVGAGFQNADTSGLPGGGIGASFTTTNDTFNEIADRLRHKVRVSLEAETYSQATGAFTGGNGTTIQRVLDRTWNIVELVGKPLSVSHFVTDITLGGFTFLSRSLTYTPHFLVGDTIDPAGIHDEIFTGSAYQELLTNFPLGSQILMGLKLNMDLMFPNGQIEHQERMLVDRLGYANRQNSITANFAVDANGQAALSPMDFFTVNVLPGQTDPRGPVALASSVQQDALYLSQFAGVASNVFPSDYNQRMRNFALDSTRLISLINNRHSDEANQVISHMGQIAAYEDSSRLVLVVAKHRASTETTLGAMEFSIDLRRDRIRAIAAPGQSKIAIHSFPFLRGMVVTEIERDTLSRLAPPELPDYNFNTNTVLFAAATQQIPILTLNILDIPRLSNVLHASSDAHARISNALASGRIVVVPQRPVSLGTAQRTSWYEIDPMTNETISVGENGDHVSLIEYAINTFTFGIVAGVSLAGFNGVSGGAIKQFVEMCMNLETVYSGLALFFSNPTLPQALGLGLGTFGIPASLGFLPGLGAGWKVGLFVTRQDPPAEGQYLDISPAFSMQNVDTQSMNIARTPGQNLRLVPATNTASTDQNSSAVISYNVESDIAGEYTVTAISPFGWSVDVSSTELRITPAPGTQSGSGIVRLVARSASNTDLVTSVEIAITVLPTVPQLEFDLTSDPLLTVPFLGAQLPTGYRAVLRNLGPGTESYTLSVSNVSPGWEVILSKDQSILDGGEIGVRGVYLRPTDAFTPIPGTSPSFSLTATSDADPTRTVTRTINATIPNVASTVLLPPKLTLAAIPNSAVSSSMVVYNAGNVADTVTLSAGTLPAGVTISGLPQTLTLQPGESIEVAYTVSIAESVPLNTTAYLKLSLDKKPFGTTAPVAWIVSLFIGVPGAEAIVSASENALQLGRTDLSTLFESLGIALTSLVESPTDRIANSQAVAALDAVIRIIDVDPILAPLYSNSLTLARDQIAAATTTPEIQEALDLLASQLTSMSQTLTEIVEHGFNFSLASNVVTALPGAPARFPILLENKGSQATTFDLTVGALPFGATASFSQSTVTLQPGERLDGGPSGVTLSLSFTDNSLFPTGFTVIATPQEAISLAQQASASVAVRAEFIQVATVTPTPAFTEPGGSVAISARILNVVNREQVVLVSYRVTDKNGLTVFTSPAQSVTLNVRSSLIEVALPAFDTTALARSDYTITVLVTDASATPFPGASGQVALLVGTPVSATLAVSPDSLLSTTSIVTNTLRLDARTVMPNPLTLLGQVQTLPTATTILVNGNIAYVAGTNGIDIVNVANPSAPQVVGTFGQGQIVQGGFTVVRALSGDRIIVATRGTLNAATFTLLTYSIANPTAPVLLGQSTIAEQFITDLFVVGNRALATTYGILFMTGNVISQFGDVLSLDLANPAAVTVSDELFGNATDDYNQNGGEVVDASTLYVASTTSTGGFQNTQLGNGVVRVIDYSNPANLSEIRDVTIPGTVQVLEIAVEGNRALVVGSTGGWKSPFLGEADAQLTGRMTLTLLDITDRRNPFVLGTTLVTESLNRPIDTADGGAKLSTLALGNGRFAISRGYVDGRPVLLLADINGDDIVVASISVPSLVNEMSVVNNTLYTTSQSGLLIYDVGTIEGSTTTVTVQVPNSNAFPNVNRVRANSFNIRPDQIISGAGSDTLVWNRPLAFGTTSSTLTWQTDISGLVPGESRDVTNGTNIAFTHAGTPGAFALPATSVVGQNAVAISPAAQTVAPGTSATYTVTLTNPTNRFLSFTLSTSGVPSSWVDIPRNVIVDANSTKSETLKITAPASTPNGSSDFVVFASANGAYQGTAQGTLVLDGVPITPDSAAHGVVATITPTTAIAGQGTDAIYVVRLTNTGSETETFTLSSALPVGVTGAFESTLVTIPPGTNNFREITLVLTPSVGTASGQYSFAVTATSTNSSATNSANGELVVVANGVSVELNSNTGIPGDMFQIKVTNTGTVADTFDVKTAGPAGGTAVLSSSQLTLAPNQSQIVNVTTASVDFAVPGTFNFTVFARSQSIPTIAESDSVELEIRATKGLASRFDPASKELPTPGATEFILFANNIGNTEDAYAASINAVDGPITANLIGLDGRPTQSIPILRLPGLATGAIRLNTVIAGVGQGSVKVQIRSLTDGSVVSESTAMLSALAGAPIANPDSFFLVQGDHAILDLLANDRAGGSPFNRNSLQFRNGPNHASISFAGDGSAVWTPDATYYGPDSFSYRAADNNGVFSNWTLVSVDTNGRPIARYDEAYVGGSGSTLVEVLNNDEDPDGSLNDATIEIVSSTDAAIGQVDVINNILRFIPSLSFNSSLVVQYRVVDSKRAASAIASVLMGVYNQNPFNPLDVDRDTFVGPLDVLLTVNSLNAEGTRRIAPGNNTAPFYDVNADGALSPLDTLMIINYLNARSSGNGRMGEGEQSSNAMHFMQPTSRNSWNDLRFEDRTPSNSRYLEYAQPTSFPFETIGQSPVNSFGKKSAITFSDDRLATDVNFGEMADWELDDFLSSLDLNNDLLPRILNKREKR